jgi:hypothetical protein
MTLYALLFSFRTPVFGQEIVLRRTFLIADVVEDDKVTGLFFPTPSTLGFGDGALLAGVGGCQPSKAL